METKLSTGEAGAAYGRAMQLLGEDGPVFVDSVLRYARAVDVATLTHMDWHDRGCPLFLEHSNGALYPHPLVKQIRAAERDAASYARQLGITPASEPWGRKSAREATRARGNARPRKAARADDSLPF